MMALMTIILMLIIKLTVVFLLLFSLCGVGFVFVVIVITAIVAALTAVEAAKGKHMCRSPTTSQMLELAVGLRFETVGFAALVTAVTCSSSSQLLLI